MRKGVFMKRYLHLFFFLLLTWNCATEKKETVLQPIYVTLPPCGCTAKTIRPVAVRKILDTGLEEYTVSKKIILDPAVEEELLSVPEIFLYDVSIQEKKKDISTPTGKTVWEATGKISEPKLEVFLKEKNVEEVQGHKVYTKRGTGQRGLELIQSYSKEKRAKRNIDRDKYYKDRIDMLEKYKR